MVLFLGQDISDITVQFPSLAQDINIPKLYPEEKFFSSVFRISSPQGQLWTHYDVSIANIFFFMINAIQHIDPLCAVISLGIN